MNTRTSASLVDPVAIPAPTGAEVDSPPVASSWRDRFVQRASVFPRAYAGVSALEYAILVGVLAAAIIAALTTFSAEISNALATIATNLQSNVGNVGN